MSDQPFEDADVIDEHAADEHAADEDALADVDAPGADAPDLDLDLDPDTAPDARSAPGDVPVTGDERVDAALGRLPELDRLPTAEHVAVYEEVHRSLHDALGAASSPAAGPGPGSPRPGFPGPPRR